MVSNVINGDTMLSLELVEHPSILERPLVHLSSLLLESFDDTLVNSSRLVDEMDSGGGHAGVDMADDHDVDVNESLPIIEA